MLFDSESTLIAAPATSDPSQSAHTTSPSSSLPPEILVEIFKLLAQDDVTGTSQELALLQTRMEIPPSESSLWNAAEVCSMWRMVAISTPGLWSNIVVNLRLTQLANQQHDRRFYWRANVSRFRERIMRSGNTAITLQVRIRLTRPTVLWYEEHQEEEGDYESGYASEGGEERRNINQTSSPASEHDSKERLVRCCVPLIQLLISCASRVSAFELWINHWVAIDAVYDFFTLSNFTMLHAFRRNSLYYDDDIYKKVDYISEDFDTSGDWMRGDASGFKTATNLQKLELFQWSFDWLRNVHWGRLTHLHLWKVDYPFSFSHALAATKSLQHLIVAFGETASATELDLNLHHLPELQYLNLRGKCSVVAVLLQKIIAPSLKTLHLAFEQSSDSLLLLQQSAYPDLADLYLDLVKEYRQDNFELMIKPVLLMAPSTRRLTFVSKEGMFNPPWLQTTLKALAEDGYICAELNEAVIYCKDGDVRVMKYFLNHRATVRLSCFCDEVWSVQGDEVNVRKMMDEGRLRVTCKTQVQTS